MKSAKSIISFMVGAGILLSVVAVNAVVAKTDSEESAFRGIYDNAFTAFADSTDVSETGSSSEEEEAQQPSAEKKEAEFYETKGMLSNDKKYLLLVTAFSYEEAGDLGYYYSNVGYNIAENGAEPKEYATQYYYTSVSVKTSSGTTKTYIASDIYQTEIQSTGLIVYEVERDATKTYSVQAYMQPSEENSQQEVAKAKKCYAKYDITPTAAGGKLGTARKNIADMDNTAYNSDTWYLLTYAKSTIGYYSEIQYSESADGGKLSYTYQYTVSEDDSTPVADAMKTYLCFRPSQGYGNYKISYDIKVEGDGCSLSNGEHIDKTVTATSDEPISIYITATTDAKFTVTISNIQIEHLATVTLDKTTAEVDLAETTTMTLQATTSDGSEVVWSSSDEKVATVENGVVTLLKTGTVTIKATSGEISASCKITVVDTTPAQGGDGEVDNGGDTPEETVEYDITVVAAGSNGSFETYRKYIAQGTDGTNEYAKDTWYALAYSGTAAKYYQEASYKNGEITIQYSGATSRYNYLCLMPSETGKYTISYTVSVTGEGCSLEEKYEETFTVSADAPIYIRFKPDANANFTLTISNIVITRVTE